MILPVLSLAYPAFFMTVRREVARDMREERDSRDVRALSLLVALSRPVSPESGIGEYSRSAHE